MLRKINDEDFLFLCQSANWQCVVRSEDEESAATLAIEKVMLCSEGEKDDKFSLSMVVMVKKLITNLIESEVDSQCASFYSPVILANAGFHNESATLHKYLQEQLEQLENEDE